MAFPKKNRKQDKKTGADLSSMNRVQNWRLYSFSVHEVSDTTVILRCVLNGMKIKGTDSYADGMFVSVICNTDKCQVIGYDFERVKISVDGGFAVGAYKKQDGTMQQEFKIFASRVEALEE